MTKADHNSPRHKEPVMNNPKALVIAPFCFPASGGENIVALKFLSTLMSKGYRLHVIQDVDGTMTLDPDEPELFTELKRDCFSPMLPNSSSSVTQKLRILRWIHASINYGDQYIRKEKPDLIISRVMPVYGHVPALILSKRFDLPWIANWSDPAPVNLGPKPYGRGRERYFSMTKSILNRVVSQASHHTFPNQHLCDYMCSFYPGLVGKSSVIPHIAHTKLSPTTTTIDSPCFTFCHVGGLGLRSPRLFLEAIRKFLFENPEASINILFAGEKDPVVDEFSSFPDVGPVIHQLGRIPYIKSLTLLSESEVNVLIEANLDLGLFFPSKVTDFIQCNKPILSISPKTGFMAELLKDEKAGIAVDNTDISSIHNTIKYLYDLWKNGELKARFSTITLQDRFNEDAVFESFNKIVKQVIHF